MMVDNLTGEGTGVSPAPAGRNLRRRGCRDSPASRSVEESSASLIARRIETGPRSGFAKGLAQRTGRDPLAYVVTLVMAAAVSVVFALAGADSALPVGVALVVQLLVVVALLRGAARSVRRERDRLEGLPPRSERRAIFTSWAYPDLVKAATSYYEGYQQKPTSVVAEEERVTYLLVEQPGDGSKRLVAVFDPDATVSPEDIAAVKEKSRDLASGKATAVTREFSPEAVNAGLQKSVFLIDCGNAARASTRGFVYASNQDKPESAPSSLRIALRSLPMAVGLRPV